MDCTYNEYYNRCRQFTPPGWGTARMLQPCYRKGRPVQFQAPLRECRPAYQPIIVPSKCGMNEARDPSIRENPDPCHGRRFCPPCNQAPLNIQLNMCQVPNPPQSDDCNKRGNNNGNNMNSSSMQGNYGGGGSGNYGSGTQSGDFTAQDYCRECPNTCPLPRCPPGVKVERTLPIIPIRRLQESAFKMPNSSVYKTDYICPGPVNTPSYAPERIAAESEGKLQSESLTKVDYVPHPVCPYKKPPWAFSKPREESNMKMYGISCYKTDYVPKEGSPAISAKPIKFIDAEAPAFDDRTMYQVEFIEHPIEYVNEAIIKKKLQIAEYSVNCVPFDGITIYKQDYIPKCSKPALSVIDKDRRLAKELPAIEGKTTYKTDYQPFYFDETECIPAEIYDCMYPPKDKCNQVRCFCEADRELEDPVQPPVPPCPPRKDEDYCPSPCEMRCAQRVTPCISPYTLRKEKDDCATVIRVEHNTERKSNNQGIVHDCPPKPCKPGY